MNPKANASNTVAFPAATYPENVVELPRFACVKGVELRFEGLVTNKFTVRVYTPFGMASLYREEYEVALELAKMYAAAYGVRLINRANPKEA